MRDHGIHLVRFVRELLLSPSERDAARAERRAEAATREERENRYSHERRKAPLEAERRRNENADRAIFGPMGHPGTKRR